MALSALVILSFVVVSFSVSSCLLVTFFLSCCSHCRYFCDPKTCRRSPSPQNAALRCVDKLPKYSTPRTRRSKPSKSDWLQMVVVPWTRAASETLASRRRRPALSSTVSQVVLSSPFQSRSLSSDSNKSRVRDTLARGKRGCWTAETCCRPRHRYHFRLSWDRWCMGVHEP